MKIPQRKNKFHAGIFFLLFFLSKYSSSQQFTGNNYGVIAGCVISAGTHVTQLGFFVRAYYTNDRFQWNNDVRMNYYFRYLGPKKPHPELQLSTGILFGYGKKDLTKNLFIGKVGNQTLYENSVAYAFNAYFNNVKTTQQTGTIALQWNHFNLNLENDLLARTVKDRFRTGAIQVAYQKDNFRFAMSHVMWTGKLGNGIRDTAYPSPIGYLDTINSVYATMSNGILALSAEAIEGEFQQQLKGSVGLDAEQLRHAVQNRFVHDEKFLPKKLRKPINYHFPMIDDKGQQYLFKPGQKIRKPKLYFNLFTNPDLIY